MRIESRTWSIGICPECGAQTLTTNERYSVSLIPVAASDYEWETVKGTRYSTQCANPSCDYGDADDSGV